MLSYRLYLDLDNNGTMETYRSSGDPNAWPIERTVLGDTVTAKVKLPPGVGLPYAKHKIEWIASDNCGNQSLCKYEFIVKDCKPPTVVCINGLSVNIMPSGMITFWDTDFLKYTNDNCTPVNQIKLGIRKAGTGIGFPLNSHSVTFDCNEIGTNYVELWAVDAYGNASYCTTYLIVQDHVGACMPPGPITGNVQTDQAQLVAGAKILLKSNLNVPLPQLMNGVTNAQGNFQFASAPGTCNYSLVPSLDTLPQAGVTTLDALLVAQYLTGQDLANTYRLIAADANHDGKITAADVEDITSVVTGVSTKFTNNTAWRFVPATFTFPEPKNPWATLFPESIKTLCPATDGLNQNFMAIKTGDVDGSLLLNAALGTEDRSATGTVWFQAPNRRFAAGETVTVEIQTPDLADLQGFQFALTADAAYLTLQSATPGLVPAKALGLHPDQNQIVVSWYSTATFNGASQRAFTLTFKALQAGTVQEVLHVSDVVSAEAYDRVLQTKRVDLQFAAPKTVVERAVFYPVAPNPTSGPIRAAYWLPVAGPVTISLVDASGRVLERSTDYREAGYQQTDLTAQESGVLFLHLQWSGGAEVQRVVVRK